MFCIFSCGLFSSVKEDFIEFEIYCVSKKSFPIP